MPSVVHDRFERCVYRPGQIARCPARAPERRLTPTELDTQLEQGDQRVGRTIFRTECPTCIACEPVRLDVAAFVPTRSQRRVIARNADLTVEVGPPGLSRRRVKLWNEHRKARALLTDHSRTHPQGYQEWLVESCAPTVDVRFLKGARLIGVSLLDIGVNAANSAYHYFEPAAARRSLGVFSVLREVQLCTTLGIRWYYLGLWAADADALSYKSGYYPHERLIQGEWVRFARREDDPAVDDPEGYAAAAVRTPAPTDPDLTPLSLVGDPSSDDSEGETEYEEIDF